MAKSSYSSGSTGSPPQGYFSIPAKPNCRQILASFNAGIPPAFKANIKKGDFTSVPYEGKTTRLKNETAKPRGSLPPMALSTWGDLSPEVKLPDFRSQSQGDIYYTRGRLCQSLNRTRPEFDLSDPNNKRKVLELKEYSALHDPHCKTYFKTPTVLKHLKKQKLINERKEVLCTVNEFNHYRSYLGALFCDQVRRRISNTFALRDLERNLGMAIISTKSPKRKTAYEVQVHQQRHRQLNKAHVEAIKQRRMLKVETWKRKIHNIERDKVHVGRAKAGMHTLRHWNAFRTRKKADKTDELKKNKTLTRIAYKEIKNDYTTKYDQFVDHALSERFKADQAAIMIARDEQIDDMQELVDESLKNCRTTWIKHYDNFIIKSRADPMHKYYHRKNREARQKYLKRKYFDLWIDFIIRRRDEKNHPLHQTIFNVDKKMKPFVDKMKKISDSDLESDDELNCENVACIERKKKAQAKLYNLVRLYPSVRRLPSAHGHGDHHHHSKISLKPSKVGSKKHLLAKPSTADGHEADTEERDEFIDKMVARYRMENQLLRRRLNPAALVTREPLPMKLQSGRKVNENQEGLRAAVKVLSDVNRMMEMHEKDSIKLGWRAVNRSK